MKIAEIKPTVVNVPFSVRFSSSVGSRSFTTRTIVRVRTEDGAEGIGETFRGRPTAALVEALAPKLIGLDALNVEHLLEQVRMVPFFYGYIGFAAVAGIEMACWDLLGKVSQQPLHTLLGGKVRSRIPVSGIVTKKPHQNELRGNALAQALAEDGRDLVTKQQVSVIKLKGSHDPQQDILNMEALEEEFQGTVRLRVDPNAVWTVADTLRLLPRLENLTMDYLEDPVEGLDAMARVGSKTSIPLATNMCVVKPDDLPVAFRLNAVDVVLADVHKWGGITKTRKLCGACEFLGIRMSIHSGSELGISTAANLHVAAATPNIDHAIDTTLSLQEGDVINEEPFQIAEGSLPIPGGPGLGVSIDEDKLRFFAALNEREGDSTV